MLRISQVVKYLGGQLIVNKMSLDVAAGSLVSLLGPSGCGKTTMLRMIAGLITPDDGEIRLGDKLLFSAGRVDVPAEKRDIGMVFQSYALWPHYTVFNNVAYPLRLRYLSRRDIKERVGEALDLVKLGSLQDRYPGELSGGQQQRVALARAIVYEPSLLLLDEPLANLDAQVREEVRSEIKELQRKAKITAVYVTHDQSEALALSDKVVVMDRGQLAQEGPPVEIYRRPTSGFVAGFVGTSNLLPAVVRRVEGDRCIVRTHQGLDVICRDTTKRRSAGESVLLSVRPEDFELHPVPRQGLANAWQARIVQSAFLGHAVTYSVMAAGETLRIQADPYFGTESNEAQVFVSLREDRVRVLDEGAEDT